MMKYDEIVEVLDSISESVDQYMTMLDEQQSLSIENKQLEDALKGEITLLIDINRLRSSIIWICKVIDSFVDISFSSAYKTAISDTYKVVSSTDAKHIAETDDEYIKWKMLKNDALRVRYDVDALFDIVESRKYILKDLTASIINGCNGYLL